MEIINIIICLSTHLFKISHLHTLNISYCVEIINPDLNMDLYILDSYLRCKLRLLACSVSKIIHLNPDLSTERCQRDIIYCKICFVILDGSTYVETTSAKFYQCRFLS